MRILTVKDECDSLKCFQLQILNKDGRIQPTSLVTYLIRNVGIKSRKHGEVCKPSFSISLNNLCLSKLNLFWKTKKPSAIYSYNLKFLLLLAGDIHTNPGPNKELLIGTYNIRGLSDKNKTKRILNYISNQYRYERMIYSFQETHITDKRRSELQFGWRGGFVLSPGQSNSRGVLTCYSNKTFDSILYSHGDPNGRATWLVGEYDKKIELFVSIYAPNNGLNREYYTSITKEVKRIAELYNVLNIFILGDFNINLTPSSCKLKLDRLIRTFKGQLKGLGLSTVSDKLIDFTWCHGLTRSKIDYIISSKHVLNALKSYNTIWGIDKSDHAAVEMVIDLKIVKGPGLYRPDTSFLDNHASAEEFRSEVLELAYQIPTEWDPHTKLECFKMNIRTMLGVYSKKHNNRLNSLLENTRLELNSLIEAKNMLINNNSKTTSLITMLKDIESDIKICRNNLDKLLTEKSKYLATRARVNWLEQGERSNKYFLNIIYSNSYKSYINELFDSSGISTTDNDTKVDIAHNFFANLYEEKNTLPSDEYLSNFSIPELSLDDFEKIDKPLTNLDLTNALRKCGITASGPDGIGYKTIRFLWDTYSLYLMNSWNYGLSQGCLAPSHRESVICLLEKKGKDRRYINNLRPISLSNCDIKVITKAITAKLNLITPKLIHPMQAAYIPNRQVHDNIRLINLVKDYCKNLDNDPILVSLDAQKAFDSVSHRFIEDILYKYNFPISIIKMFKTLYTSVTSKVLINGFMSKNFKLNRSVKQGDALSCILFNLCVDSLIRSISNDNNIPPISILNLDIPKAVAYADDVAILTLKHGLQAVFDKYEQFSQVSGLYLNVDKTEVLALSNYTNKNPIVINSVTSSSSLKFTDKVKICGITFSLDKEKELNDNVIEKVCKMKNAIKGWSKRGLSIFGRNLIFKTFGLSQVIYVMQNTVIPEIIIKEIRSIIFNFLWNKKEDKTRAYERVSRRILYLPKSKGGINAPNIDAIDKALKVKQLIRSSTTNNEHFIRTLQDEILGSIRLLNKVNTESDFLNVALTNLNTLGDLAICELISNREGLYNKQYYDLISAINLETLLNFKDKNDISCLFAKKLRKDLGIFNVKQFLNEFKFPSTENHKHMTKFIINSIPILFNILLKRKVLDEDASIIDGLPIGCNKIVSYNKLTTKALTHRFNLGLEAFVRDDEETKIVLNYGLHPKENEIIWLEYHKACLTNEKLFKMNLVESPMCPRCLTIQNHSHIFYTCQNAVDTWEVCNEFDDINITEDEKHYGSKSKQSNELILLIKRTLFLNKNETIDKKFIRFILSNRLSDLKMVHKKKVAIRLKGEAIKNILLIGAI